MHKVNRTVYGPDDIQKFTKKSEHNNFGCGVRKRVLMGGAGKPYGDIV